MSIEHCARCQTCSDACHIYEESGRNPLYRPTYRSEILRRIYYKYVREASPWVHGDIDLSWKTVVRLIELSYRCNVCRRCAQTCPIGVDNALLAREIRKIASQELGIAAKELHEQLLGMSLGVEDFNTICFALDVDWRPFAEMSDEAGKTEMLVRQLEDQGRVDEVTRFVRDFRFPQGYPPLSSPPTDNLWLTYVYACQNVESLDQLQTLVEQIGMTDATQLPGDSVPHKIREAIWVAKRANALPYVHDWLRSLTPEEGLNRPRIRERRRRVHRDAGSSSNEGYGRS